MVADSPLEVCNVATKATFNDGSRAIFILNQFLLENSEEQTESLLNPHQLRAYHVRVDDVPRHHRHVYGTHGKQCIVVDGVTFPLHFDGFKTYFTVSRSTHRELDTLPRYLLTAPHHSSLNTKGCSQEGSKPMSP